MLRSCERVVEETLSHSLSSTTWNQVRRGIVLHCICRFIRSAINYLQSACVSELLRLNVNAWDKQERTTTAHFNQHIVHRGSAAASITLEVCMSSCCSHSVIQKCQHLFIRLLAVIPSSDKSSIIVSDGIFLLDSDDKSHMRMGWRHLWPLWQHNWIF